MSDEHEKQAEELLDRALAKAYAGGAPDSFKAIFANAARAAEPRSESRPDPRAEPLGAPGVLESASANENENQNEGAGNRDRNKNNSANRNGNTNANNRLGYLVPIVAVLGVAAGFLLRVRDPHDPSAGQKVADLGTQTAPDRAGPGENDRASDMTREAVNDHLRVLYSQHPIEIESGGIHQVKPWFAGKLDFGPANDFAGDQDFPLVGGAVGYFLDRKAATYVYKRNLHVITLFVFPADGLPWGTSNFTIGHTPGTPATRATVRGFHVLLWRKGDLGYALASDLNETELTQLGERIEH